MAEATMTQAKVCTKCGKTKPLEGYHRHAGAPDGRRARCKECVKASLPPGYVAPSAQRARAAAKARVLTNAAIGELSGAKPDAPRRCKKCERDLRRADFPRGSGGRLSRYCKNCTALIAEQRENRRPANYYHSPEYKRLQRHKQASQEGRELHAFRSGEWRRKTWVTPADYSETEWRRLEEANARQAWRWWVAHGAPSWWLEARTELSRERQRRVDRAKRQVRRARKRAGSDGTLGSAELERVLSSRRTCIYCGVSMTRAEPGLLRLTDATVEHLVPLSAGGVHGTVNVTACCVSCNSRRRDKPLVEWLAALTPARANAVRRLYRKRYGVGVDQQPLPLVHPGKRRANPGGLGSFRGRKRIRAG